MSARKLHLFVTGVAPRHASQARWTHRDAAGPPARVLLSVLALGYGGRVVSVDRIEQAGRILRAQATRKQVDNSERPDPDWAQGYGYQFWVSRHGYRGDGAFGQFCVVMPEQEAVLAITSGVANMQRVLDDAQLRTEMRAAGRIQATRFSWRALADATVASYGRAVRN